MSDFLQKLRQARSAPRTVVGRLRSDYAKDSSTLHLFFEGRDAQSFYMTFVNRHAPVGWRVFTYRCAGKAGVHEISEAIDPDGFDRERLLFFVDKDLEEFLGDEWPRDGCFFATRWYSIENYVVCESTFLRAVRELLHADLTNEEETLLVEQFGFGLASFHSSLLLLSAWILVHRRRRSSLNLNNIDLAHLFDIRQDFGLECIAGYRAALDYLHRATGVSNHEDIRRDIIRTARELKRLPPKQYSRGKYELWFLVRCLQRLPSLLNSIQGDGTRRVRTHTQITLRNAVEALGPRTPEPAELSIFLKSRLLRLAS